MGPMRQALVLSLVWSRPHAPPLPRTRSPRTKPSRAWHPCPLPRLSPPASYRTSSTHPPLCPKLSSPLPHGYMGVLGGGAGVRGYLQCCTVVVVMDTEGPLDLSHLCSSGVAPLSWDSSLDPLRSKYCGAPFPHSLLSPGSHAGLPSHLGSSNS